jgi:hypothetical protein|tara:strand:+ start:1124 stop:1336 length:213 start_codon:yes stop_codon:yes gene_type:complete
MTYHSKGELFDEVMYKLAREIYKTRLEGSEESTKSWEETFLKHSGVTIDEYIKYAQENNLKEKYINAERT